MCVLSIGCAGCGDEGGVRPKVSSMANPAMA